MSIRIPTITLPAVILTAGLLTASLPAAAVQAFTAQYQASAMGMQGDGQMSLTSQGNNRWQYSLTIQNQLVDLSQKTVFDEQNGWLRPLSSSDISRLLVKKKAVNANFDWAKNQATWTGDVKPERAGPVALKPGDMDALLVNLALVRDVAAGKPLNYRLVDNGVVRTQAYQNLGKDTVTVGGQPRSATKVSRSTDNKQVIVWVVDGLPVPARILQKKDGNDELDLVLKSVR